nr:MAG TPA: tail tape measure protein [Caudoviricetes sp.]
MTQAVDGLRSLGSNAINAYGNIQQSFGGLDTIYKESSSNAKEYASQAQKMGISMNTYAEQAVSMGAALKQSLGGDVQAAAQKANLAISDMADNSAKMGTSIDSLQNAYQGFAKGNYTMLDNLKLGFGGTKEEMERLLKTAGDLPEAMGRKFDISNYADIVDAIHLVQENMGVAGVAAAEAQTTIQGSMNAAKAAFENLLAAMGDPNGNVDAAMQTFLDSLMVAWDNLAPTLQAIGKTVLEQIGKGIEAQLAPFKENFVGTVGGIVESIGEFVSEIAGDNEIVNGVADAIKFLGENMDKVLPVIGGLTAAIITFNAVMTIQTIIKGAVAAFQAFQAANEGATVAQWLLNAALSANPIVLVVAAIAGLIAAIAILWNTNEGFRNAVMNAWQSVVDFFTKTIPSAFASVVEWFGSLYEQISSFLGNIISSVGQWVSDMASKAVEIGTSFVQAIVDFFSNLPYNIGLALGTFIGTVISFGGQLISKAIEIGSNFVANVIKFFSELPGKIASLLANIISAVGQWASNMASSAAKAGSDFVSGVVNFVSSLPSKITEFLSNVINAVITWGSNLVSTGTKAAGDLANAIINGVSSIPSRMLEIGQNIVDGLAGGISAAWSGLANMVGGLVGGFIDGIKGTLGIHSPSRVFKYIGEMCVAGFEEGTEDLMNLDNISSNISASWGTMSANMSGGMSRNTTFNFYDTQTSPDAIMRKAENTFQFGLAGGI